MTFSTRKRVLKRIFSWEHESNRPETQLFTNHTRSYTTVSILRPEGRPAAQKETECAQEGVVVAIEEGQTKFTAEEAARQSTDYAEKERRQVHANIGQRMKRTERIPPEKKKKKASRRTTHVRRKMEPFTTKNHSPPPPKKGRAHTTDQPCSKKKKRKKKRAAPTTTESTEPPLSVL